MNRFVLKTFQSLTLLAFMIGTTAWSASPTGSVNAYSHTVTDIDGKQVKLERFQGKVALIVNTASECGFTSQYKDLEALYALYKNQGFVVLGFPSNDFGGQEPGTNSEIKKFCEMKFKVTFPMFSKEKVKGQDKQPLYRTLTEHAPESGEVSWNFEKFLIDKKGRVIGRFKSRVTPLDPKLTSAIETALK